MGLVRRLRREWKRRSGDVPDTKPQVVQMLKSGGYRVLHPTKGWRTVSPKRLKHFPGAVA